MSKTKTSNAETTDAALRALPARTVIARLGVDKAMSYKCVGALIFTYRCSISCAHCLFGCGPRVQSPPMRVDDGLFFLRQIHELDRVVHVAGGEAFLYWDDLAELAQKAGRQGIAPHFVETNSSWAASDTIVRERFKHLRDCGVLGIYLSADPYHFMYVPADNYLRARAIACEMFGEPNVPGHKVTAEKAEEFVRIGRDTAQLAAHVQKHTPMMVGNAAQRLAQYLSDVPVERLDLRPGANSSFASGCFRGAVPPTVWEVHIDPHANIQTNCGIVLGNARRTHPQNVLQQSASESNPIVSAIAGNGPRALLDMALARGCAPITHAKTKCHLCYKARTYLRPFYPELLGPDEAYPTAAQRPSDRTAPV